MKDNNEKFIIFYKYLVIEYLVPNSGKLYHHKIKIRELKSDSDKEKVLKQIKRRHEMYLTKIADKQLLSNQSKCNRIYFKNHYFYKKV